MKNLTPTDQNRLNTLRAKRVDFEQDGKRFVTTLGQLKNWHSTHGANTSVGISKSFLLTKIGKGTIVAIDNNNDVLVGTPADFSAAWQVIDAKQLVENPLPSSGH